MLVIKLLALRIFTNFGGGTGLRESSIGVLQDFDYIQAILTRMMHEIFEPSIRSLKAKASTACSASPRALRNQHFSRVA
jgi:hypothetical protein